ncbi:MAG: SusC/RagA family TonB-linked outer membrane protein [Bacteroidota bacterium]
MRKLLSMIVLVLAISSSFEALAQSRTLTGKIEAPDGTAIVGATVLIPGTQVGALTGANGEFTLEAPAGSESILVKYIGFEDSMLSITDSDDFSITLSPTDLTLDEVVVTAFGLERDKKALGYSVQEVDASELTEARSTNVVNSLSGRVAGIQITGASGVGGGSQVTIRGNASILGNNQPLYVVDGVPIEGDFAAPTGSDAVDNNVYGGGVSEISPDNIESISVLKGPSATALYGSRASNGVILITTKTGKGTDGIGIDYNLNMTWEKPFVVPEFQNIYGGGNGYVTWYADGRNGGITDPLAIEQFRAAYPNAPLVGTAGVDESWGAPMDGRLVRHWWTGEELAPLVPVPDTWENLWETGNTMTHTLAISGSNDVAYFRLAMGITEQNGLLYNNDFSRNNFRLNTGFDITDKLSIKVSSSYIKSGSDNRQQPVFWEPQTWHNRHVDWGQLKNYKDYMDVHITRDGDEYPYANWQHSFALNRFYEQEFLTDANDKDRFLGNIALTYDITDELSLMLRSGTDLWTDTRVNVTRGERTKSGDTRTQSYSEEVLRRQETNSDFILSYDKNFDGLFSVSAKIGGVHRTNYYKRNFTQVNDVTINGLYNVANNASTNTDRSRIEEKEVNSLFGALNLGFKGFLFLDVTARNDWSSTLPVENNSYFYPSFALSAVLTDMLGIQSDVLSFAKLRASWAEVGNDTDPYRLQQVFIPRDAWNSSTPVFSENTTIANNELRPEKTTGFELGADVRLFNNRLGIDATYYNQTTTDQIIAISVSKATGYDSKVINAGEITNQGIEVMLYGTPVKTESGFQWDVTLNYARNVNEVVDLFTDANGNELETIVLHSRRGLSLEARKGEPYGTFVGSAYQRVPDGPLAGQIVFKDGIPQKEASLQVIGNATPDFTGGIQNTFTFKNFSLSALVDAKIGGDIADESSSTGMQTGIYPITAIGREEGVIGKGAKWSESAQDWVPNDVVGDTKSVVRQLSVRSVNEGAIYEASYVKLREVRFSYRLPAPLLEKIGFVKSARLSVVGRNVAMLYNTHPQIDPELNIYGGNLQGALYYATIPSSRSLGFDLNLSF